MNAVLLYLLPVLGIIANANQLVEKLPACAAEHGALLPMAGSCTGFYICHYGNAVASTCGEFYHFNAKKGICDHPSNVNCNQDSTLLADYMQRPQVEDPSTYAASSQQHIGAAPGHAWPKPTHPFEVNVDVSAGAICIGQRDGVQLPKTNACQHFYICIQQYPYRRTCPRGTHFNAALGECQLPVLAKCEQPKKKTNLASLICAGAEHGSLVAHSADCGKFFYCDHALPMEMKCPKGLHFSAKNRICTWPQQAECTKLYRTSA